MSDDALQRKYQLSKVDTGDYLWPSNDAATIWRVQSYVDGPSSGLDWPRDRTMWRLLRWTGPTGLGCIVDTAPESSRWEEVASVLPSRRAAIDYAMGTRS